MEEAEEEIILLKDFNAHYPAWGRRQVASEIGAENFYWILSDEVSLF